MFDIMIYFFAIVGAFVISIFLAAWGFTIAKKTDHKEYYEGDE